LTVNEVLVNGKPYIVKVLDREGNFFTVEVSNKTVKVQLKNKSRDNVAILEVNGNTFHANLEYTQRNLSKIEIDGRLLTVEFPPKLPKKEVIAKVEPVVAIARKPTISAIYDKNAVTAPIAGKLALWKAKIGQKVEKGECVCVLEAMKMANEIAAPKSGILKEIRVCQGAVVNKGDVLAVID